MPLRRLHGNRENQLGRSDPLAAAAAAATRSCNASILLNIWRIFCAEIITGHSVARADYSIASALKGEAKRCRLCGGYASKFCDYLDCPHLEQSNVISIDLSSGCKVEATADGSRITLASGAVIHGAPHDTHEYRETARKLGYGIEALAMCQDHDPLHALLCDWLGLRDSYALQCAAGLRAEDELSAAEEAAVLAVQRFMRLSGGSLARYKTETCAR